MYRAIKSFAGKVSMKKGDLKDIKDEVVIKDLLKAGYIVEEKVENVINKVEKNLENVKEEVKKVTSKKKK